MSHTTSYRLVKTQARENREFRIHLCTSLNFTVVICSLFPFIPSPSCRKEALFSSSESDFSALISQG
ncbi:hypothetical protein P8452_73845 [Trifolium repens]|nr:hypothetical protein P8452_73845 [Trifolium repens]